jgi:hypothetical protein
MTYEGKITMSEFKTVVERFEENQKKVIEVMNHRFDQVDERFNVVDKEIKVMKHDVIGLKDGVHSLKQEVALLHEGQTAIRADLRRKVSYDDFEMLEKRVARLECKVA